MSTRFSCLSCNSDDLKNILDLGMHSFADRFISKKDYGNYDPAFPLKCSLCLKCGLIQNDTITPPEERYQSSDYSYTASNSKYSIDYWRKYAKEITEQLKQLNSAARNCLEIGSNDGTLLGFFKENGLEVTGVDASPLMVSISKDRALNAYCGIFGNEGGQSKKPWENHKYDLVIANNVLNHSDNPISFCKSIAKLLKDEKSFFVFEQPYWKDLVETHSFDQIYHEHVTYFTVENAINLIQTSGLQVFKVEHTTYHGGSIRVYASKRNNQKIDKSVGDFLNAESSLCLREENTYVNLMNILKNKKIKTLEKVFLAIKENRKIICLGAAAKANTLLTYYSLDSSIINFITDASPFKIDKYTPLTRIPIKRDEDIADLDNPLCLITSWNIAETILLKLKKINPSAEFISAHEF